MGAECQVPKKNRSLPEKCPNTEFFFGPYFRAFGLNTEREFECGKIQTRENSVFGHISHSEYLTDLSNSEATVTKCDDYYKTGRNSLLLSCEIN